MPTPVKESATRGVMYAMLALLVGVVGIAVSAQVLGGQSDNIITKMFHYGDIAPSNSCVQVVVPQGTSLQTQSYVPNLGRSLAPELKNAEQLADTAVERFGPTLDEGEFVRLCASADGLRIAELNGVNLGRT